MQSPSLNLSEDGSNPITPLEDQLMDLLKEGPLTRDQMVKKLSVPRTTIYDGLKKLMVRNCVTKYPLYSEDRGRGRPKIAFTLLDNEKENDE